VRVVGRRGACSSQTNPNSRANLSPETVGQATVLPKPGRRGSTFYQRLRVTNDEGGEKSCILRRGGTIARGDTATDGDYARSTTRAAYHKQYLPPCATRVCMKKEKSAVARRSDLNSRCDATLLKFNFSPRVSVFDRRVISPRATPNPMGVAHVAQNIKRLWCGTYSYGDHSIAWCAIGDREAVASSSPSLRHVSRAVPRAARNFTVCPGIWISPPRTPKRDRRSRLHIRAGRRYSWRVMRPADERMYERVPRRSVRVGSRAGKYSLSAKPRDAAATGVMRCAAPCFS
jgi:hypothetical protein